MNIYDCFKLCVFVFLCVALVGCVGTADTKMNHPVNRHVDKQIVQTADDAQADVAVTMTALNEIQTDSDKIIESTGEPETRQTAERIADHAGVGMDAQARLDRAMERIKTDSLQIGEMKNQNAALAKSNDDLKNQLAEMKERETSAFKKITYGAMALGAVALIAGVLVLVFLKNLPLGSGLMLGGGMIMCVAYLLSKFITIILIAVSAIMIACMCYAAYLIFKEKKSFGEVVDSFEVLKDRSWNEAKEQVKKLQSVETMKKVFEHKVG